ncbi:MAG: hypothetical protein NZ878_13890, partial [SAR324 cluster bacterium]|nr:hypothetical protein [SAR324 cluster bacterium]
MDGIAKVEHVAFGENLSGGFIDVDQNSTIQTISHTKSSKIDIADQTNLTLVDAFEIPQGQAMELKGSGGGTIDISDNITLSGILKLNAENNIISGGKLLINDGMLDLDQDASIASQIILNDNASMDLSSGKKLSVTQSFEVPANLKLEIAGTDGGSLSLSETLKIAGIIQFSPPTVSSQTQYHSMIDGTLELVAGSLLDVDYHTNIASNIEISGDSTIDVASGMTLTYSGDAIDVNTYQLTFLSTGTLLNSNAVLLSNSEGLIVFADDITVALVKVEAGSSSGKGIQVKSAGAKVTNLNLGADLIIIFDNEQYVFNIENLVVSSAATLSTEGSRGLVNITELLQDNQDALLTLHNITAKVQEEIKLSFKNQIAMTDSVIFEVVGGLTFNVTGTMDFKGHLTANINLMGGTMCVIDNSTIDGDISHLANSVIYIAPEKMLTYKGENKLEVNNLELALQGGGYFSSLDNNSISLNQDGGTLKLADNATSLSHLHIDQTVSTAVLEVSQNQSSKCSEDNVTAGSSTILVENFDHAGSSNLKLADNTLLNLPSSISVPQEKSMTVTGENGKLVFGDTVTFDNNSQLVLNSTDSQISGRFEFKDRNVVDAQQN